MDVFKFTNPAASTEMQQGQIINGLKSKMWVERYDVAGEFTFVADVSSGLRTILPIGSFVSHVDATEIMIVENHEINEVQGQNSEIVITGRGFETETENQSVGANKAFPVSSGVTDYVLASDYVWNQIVALMNDHILTSSLVDPDNALPYVIPFTDLTPTSPGMDRQPVPESISRSLKRGTLYQRVLDLLAVMRLGIKIIRPGPWSPLGGTSPNTAIQIHIGVDRSKQIIISHDTGEITSADYLWSNKKKKNAALIFGKWVETTVVPALSGYDRRWMEPIDASDIDQGFTAAPTGTDLTNVINAMQARGRQALSALNDFALTKAEVAANANNTAYRKDFDVGDIITVLGSYNESSAMRISEYVEIEDETGARSYPTLTVL